MCDPKKQSKEDATEIMRQGIDTFQVFQKQMAIIPPEQARPGHCLISGEPLSHSEMYPSGFMPRHMKDREYQNIINARPRHHCVMCSTLLDDWKINEQFTYPREMSNHHCSDCWNYHVLLAGRIHNVSEAFMVTTPPQLSYQPMQRAIPHMPQPTTVIDMVPNRQVEYVPVHQRKPLPR